MVTRFPRSPRVQIPPPPEALGDILQRLSQIDPQAIYAFTMLAREVLKKAEARHLQNFKYRDPTKTAVMLLACSGLL